MPKSKPSVAFQVFDVVGRSWPSDPRQVIRVSNLLSLMACVPVLFRSPREADAAAGSFIASSLLSSYYVTKRWEKIVELLELIGNFDDEFPSEEVAFFSTTNKSRLSQRSVIPPQWRPRVLNSLEGRFFKKNISRRAKDILDKLEREYPDFDYKDEPGTWKQRRKTNIAFDMADEFSKAIIKNAADCSQLTVELKLLSWVPKLLGSSYQKDSLAGCFWLTSLLMAHAHAREWERFAVVLETIGELEDTINHDYVFIAATALKACYGHPHSLQLIPHKYHGRIREALELPFFQNHFDPDHFEIEVLARDRHMTAEEQGKGFASKLLEAMPELRRRYEKATKPYGPRTPHQSRICQLVVMPEARAALKRNESAFFPKLAAFLEELVEEGWDLNDVYGGSVIAEILDNKKVGAAIDPHLGKDLLKAIRARDRN